MNSSKSSLKHTAEEMSDAARVIPNSMIASVAINGLLGCGIIIAVLFCMGDEDTALNSPMDYPFIEIFSQAVQSNAGGSVMVSLTYRPLADSEKLLISI